MVQGETFRGELTEGQNVQLPTRERCNLPSEWGPGRSLGRQEFWYMLGSCALAGLLCKTVCNQLINLAY